MSEELCAVRVQGVTEDRFGYDFVLLVDEQGRQMPIWIGKCEAISLQLKLQDMHMPRPMTHDLVCSGVEKLGGRFTRVLIDDLWDNRYFAKICLTAGEEGEEMQVDCRPSDALAIALRAGIPIEVRDDVLAEGELGELPEGDLDASDDEVR